MFQSQHGTVVGQSWPYDHHPDYLATAIVPCQTHAQMPFVAPRRPVAAFWTMDMVHEYLDRIMTVATCCGIIWGLCAGAALAVGAEFDVAAAVGVGGLVLATTR